MLSPATTNEFDPTVLAVPTYCGNSAGTTVTISNPNLGNPQTVMYEFCALFAPVGYDSAPAKAIVVDFSDNGLTIQADLGPQTTWTPFQLTFSDSAFAGLPLVKYSDNFPCQSQSACGVTATLNGSTLTISGSIPPFDGMYNAMFTLATVYPNPNTVAMSPPWGGLALPSPVISWTPLPGVEKYRVWLGSRQYYNDNNVYDSGELPATTTSIAPSWTLWQWVSLKISLIDIGTPLAILEACLTAQRSAHATRTNSHTRCSLSPSERNQSLTRWR